MTTLLHQSGEVDGHCLFSGSGCPQDEQDREPVGVHWKTSVGEKGVWRSSLETKKRGMTGDSGAVP